MRNLYLIVLAASLVQACGPSSGNTVYSSESLIIEQLSPHIYIHTSYLHAFGFGKVACNGMVFLDQGEVAVFDTPNYDSVSVELINWIEQDLKAKIKVVVPTHFHIDCLGGLEAFHSRNIPSLAHKKTIEGAKKNRFPVPQNEFEVEIAIPVGTREVFVRHFGPGHTSDNSIAYIPSEETIFGGCLVKSQGAGKGNLEDANVKEWANTARKIKAAYPNLYRVIPGHGKAGGIELLDYTAQLFNDSDTEN